MYVVRNIATHSTVAVFAHRVNAEQFLSIGNNRNLFEVV